MAGNGTKENTPTTKSKRGRGERLSEDDLKQLHVYFQRGIGATVAAIAVKVNVKTAAKYWKQWKDDLIQRNQENLIEMVESARHRYLDALDYIMHDVILHQQKIDAKTKQFDTIVEERMKKGSSSTYVVNYFLENKRQELSEFLAQLIKDKASIEMAPTVDQLLEQHIADRMKQKNDLLQQQEPE